MTARFIVGDVRDVLATLPDNSVDLCFTSPPFLALRSYLPADHPDKGREIGSEPDPGSFIDTLLGVTEDLARVLAPHGSLCVELGDTYSGSGGGGGDYSADGLRSGQPIFDGSGRRVRETRRESFVTENVEPPARRDITAGWPASKSACLIPELYRLSLAYGRNPLTGRETPRWRVRNTIRWCRPNPPVGALGDKFRPATSEIVVACKAKDRYFDLDAVRTAHLTGDHHNRFPDSKYVGSGKGASDDRAGGGFTAPINPAGAPPLDWWKIPTHGYPGAHYATFPPALVTIPLLAMCPEKVCRECGQPSRRIVDTGPVLGRGRTSRSQVKQEAIGEANGNGRFRPPDNASRETIGWSDCGHNAWRRGLVLDPFGGSGTVAEVATGHSRDAILIDIDGRNADLARQRVGMFLTVDEPLEPLAGVFGGDG